MLHVQGHNSAILHESHLWAGGQRNTCWYWLRRSNLQKVCLVMFWKASQCQIGHLFLWYGASFMTLVKHCVAVNHQLNRSIIASGHPWRDHLDWVNWSGKSKPDCGWRHPLGLGPRQLQRIPGAEHSSHTSLPPDCATVWTPFTLCSCPRHYRQFPPTRNRNKSLLLYDVWRVFCHSHGKQRVHCGTSLPSFEMEINWGSAEVG